MVFWKGAYLLRLINGSCTNESSVELEEDMMKLRF